MSEPDFSLAKLDVGKLVDYLLSSSHPGGKSKARFFMQMGFARDDWRPFAIALQKHALVNPVVNIANSPFGVKYTVDGLLETPSGSRPAIRTVWIVEPEHPAPRLVTAHPL